MASITGLWNTQIWCEDGNPRERCSTRAGVLYACPVKGETVISFFEPSEIPAKWPEVAELKHIEDVQFVITQNRVRFTAPCALTFDDVRMLCSRVSGKLPEHAHVKTPGAPSPAHPTFWHWESRTSISHQYPAWDTGERASWEDEMCEAGDTVSLDFD